MRKENIGQTAFFVGVIIALIAGLVARDSATVGIVLLLLGVLVGLINITEKETLPYLLAAVALLVAGTATTGILEDLNVAGHESINGMLGYIIVFAAPAAVIGALRSVLALASRR